MSEARPIPNNGNRDAGAPRPFVRRSPLGASSALFVVSRARIASSGLPGGRENCCRSNSFSANWSHSTTRPPCGPFSIRCENPNGWSMRKKRSEGRKPRFSIRAATPTAWRGQRPHSRHLRRPRHLSVEGLSQQTSARVPNHHSRCRRVHSVFPDAYPAAGLSAHPLLRPDGEPPPETVSGAMPGTAHRAAKSTAARARVMPGSVERSDNARTVSLPEVLGAAHPPPSSQRHVMSMPTAATCPLNPASTAGERAHAPGRTKTRLAAPITRPGTLFRSLQTRSLKRQPCRCRRQSRRHCPFARSLPDSNPINEGCLKRFSSLSVLINQAPRILPFPNFPVRLINENLFSHKGKEQVNQGLSGP